MVELALGGELHQGVVEGLLAWRGHVREGHDEGFPDGFDSSGSALTRQFEDDGAHGLW